MSPTDFCYWLQGYTEVARQRPNEEQWKCILDHLKGVFEKVTPPMPQEKFEEALKELSKIPMPDLNKKYCSLAPHDIGLIC